MERQRKPCEAYLPIAAYWFNVIANPLYSRCSAQTTVRLTSGEWPPYQSENGLKYHGVVSRIVTDAFALQGVRTEYGFFPWKRSLIYAKEGAWDGSLVWAQGRSDFKDDFYFSDPVIVVSKALFYLKTKPVKWDKMDDLKGYIIGVTAGYTYGEEFNRAMDDGVFKVQNVTSDLQNIHKILGRRIDAFVMEVDVAHYLMHINLQADDINKIDYCPKLLMTSGMCVIFPKKSGKSLNLVRTLNIGLAKLKNDGVFDNYIRESRMGRYIK